MAKEVKKVAFLTAGGLAPCLSSSIGFLIDEYNKKSPKTEMIGYINGYMGLLKGDSIPVTISYIIFQGMNINTRIIIINIINIFLN